MVVRGNERVPFGYEPEKEDHSAKGTLIVYDDFEGWEAGDAGHLVSWAIKKRMARVVWYPLHEETVRRMGTGPVRPYYRRLEELQAWVEEAAAGNIRQTVEEWEGKRKKYTPMDTALRFIADKYPAPYFLCISGKTANLFAGYSSFDEWIRKIRLVIKPSQGSQSMHPKLRQSEHRWELLDGPRP